MTQPLAETADRINLLFRRYGLDHEVVAVKVSGAIQLDPRENEPDPMKWRTQGLTSRTPPEIAFIDGYDEAKMELLLTTLTYVFDVFFEIQPPSDQLRLF